VFSSLPNLVSVICGEFPRACGASKHAMVRVAKKLCEAGAVWNKS